jgi:hypothetical protein
LYDDLALDGLTTTAMLALAARALSYLCEAPGTTLAALIVEFTDEMGEIYEWASRTDDWLRNR